MRLARVILVMFAVFAMVVVPGAMRASADVPQTMHHYMQGAGPAAQETVHFAMAQMPARHHQVHHGHGDKCCVSPCCSLAVAGHAVVFVASISAWRLLRHPLPLGDPSPTTTTTGPLLRPPSPSASI